MVNIQDESVESPLIWLKKMLQVLNSIFSRQHVRQRTTDRLSSALQAAVHLAFKSDCLLCVATHMLICIVICRRGCSLFSGALWKLLYGKNFSWAWWFKQHSTQHYFHFFLVRYFIISRLNCLWKPLCFYSFRWLVVCFSLQCSRKQKATKIERTNTKGVKFFGA